jgi:HK97 family phage portal protein
MSIVDKFLTSAGNIIRRIDQRYESSLNAKELRQMRMVQIGAMPVYPDAKLETYIKAYTENASVFSIVNLAARKFSFIPRYVVKVDKEDQAKSYKALMNKGQWQKALNVRKKAYTNSDITGKSKLLNDLLLRPNEYQGQDAFFFAVYVSKCLCGESFTWLNRGEIDGMDDAEADKMPVLEMYWMPPNFIEVIPDDQDVYGVAGYVFVINGQRVSVRKNDVIHWKTFNPIFDATTRDHLRGHPPLKSGAKILTQDESSTDAAVAMYQNGGARGVLFDKSLKQITPTQKAAIEEIVAKRINNADLKSAVASIQGDWGYIDIGKDSVDMQLLEGNDKAFAKLCHIFGVPPGLFLIDQTYENQRSNRKRMLSELIIPDCASFNDEMNRMLLPAFGLKTDKVEPDYSELPEMQEDMKDMITYLKDSPITPNEFRDALGYDPLTLDGMDMIYQDSNKVPVEMVGISLAPDPNSNMNE